MTILVGSSLRCAGFRTLRSVFRAGLLAILNPRSVQRAAHDVITNSRQILHTASAHQHDRVFLQVMSDSRNVRRDFNRIRQAHTSYFAQRRVRLLRRLRINADAYAALFRTTRQCWRFCLGANSFAPHSDQLRKCRHSLPSFGLPRRFPAWSLGCHPETSTLLRRSRRILTVPSGSSGPANARTDFYAARFARRQLQRAHTTLKGELRIRRDQQETPHAPQEAELRSWHRFGEAYSALRDWRPISGRSSLPIRRAMFRE